MKPKLDSLIDDYITAAKHFASPILSHLRKLVHQGCPGVEETLKWSAPAFMYRGGILCSMAAFNQHCAFGFRHREMEDLLTKELNRTDEGMGLFGRIESLGQLPPQLKMLEYLKTAARLADDGIPARPTSAKVSAKQPLLVPDDLAAALKQRNHAKAAAHFAAFPPSKRKDYVEWITEANHRG